MYSRLSLYGDTCMISMFLSTTLVYEGSDFSGRLSL